MVALLDPKLEFREGGTRARFRKDVNIKKFFLVAAGGWWEKANVNLLQHVIEKLAENAGVQFAVTLFGTHVYVMQTPDGTTSDGERILSGSRRAGCELMENREFSQNTMDAISKPLLPSEMCEEYLGQ